MTNTKDLFSQLHILQQPQVAAILLLVTIMLATSGCSSLNCTRLEKILGGRTNLIDFSYSIAEKLVTRAMPPLVPRHPGMPILVTTFVDNNNLNQTSRFGRTLQEQISSRLVQLGYTVREIKIADTLHIESRHGETILSRDLTWLSKEQQAQVILVGTISQTNRILYISARLINPANNNIIASDDYQLCMDDDILDLFGLQYQSDCNNPINEPSQPFLNKIL